MKGFDFVEDHQLTLYSVSLSLHRQSTNFSVAAEVTVRLLTMRYDERPTVPGRQRLNSAAAAEAPIAAGTLLPPQDSRTKGSVVHQGLIESPNLDLVTKYASQVVPASLCPDQRDCFAHSAERRIIRKTKVLRTNRTRRHSSFAARVRGVHRRLAAVLTFAAISIASAALDPS